MDMWTTLALSILFEAMKDPKKVVKMRAALAKVYLVIARLAETDNQLAQLINPKPNA